MPRVFIGIPTGPPKKYALAYMFAALQNLDWDNLEIHFAVTRYKNEFMPENGFRETLDKYIDASGLAVHIHETWLTPEEQKQPYLPVTRNCSLLRGVFLDGDCDYFLLLGGDNPPPRSAIKHFLDMKADVASGILYQRPGRGIGESTVPMVYYPSWTLDQLDRFKLPEAVLEEFRKAWLHSIILIPAYINPSFGKGKNRVMTKFASGSGCCLIRREVLENIGFALPMEQYHSEDIHFFLLCMFYGYSIALDTEFHVSHLHEDGSVW